ncbi:MAG: hypothetical protein ACRDHG_03210 [Anaerolineales bacterium]
MKDIAAILSEDLKIARFIIHEGPDPKNPGGWLDIASIDLDADQLSTFLHEAGNRRAQMADEVPKKIDGTPVFKNVVERPRIMAGVTQRVAGKAMYLALRHPGFGWLAFILGPHESLAIMEGIARCQFEVSKRKGASTFVPIIGRKE